jgi:hypothetical protein
LAGARENRGKQIAFWQGNKDHFSGGRMIKPKAVQI